MILKNNADELNLSFNDKVEDFNYTVYAISESIMRCYGCGKIGHLIRACPEKMEENGTVQTTSENNQSRVVSVAEDVGASVAVQSVSDGLVVNKSTMAEITAGSLSVPDLMSFESADKNSDIIVSTDNMTTNVLVSEAVGELEIETESVFKVPTKRKKNSQSKAIKQKKTKMKLKV